MPRPRKIVVVDHDRAQRERTARCLRDAGYEVLERSVAMGSCALTVRENPDLVLIDDAMPLMSGADVIRSIRDSSARDCRVVIRSRVSYADACQLVASCGADGHLSTHASDQELLDTVASFTRGAARRRRADSGTRIKQGYLLVVGSPTLHANLRDPLVHESAVLFTDSGTEALRLMLGADPPSFVVAETGLIDLRTDVLVNEALRHEPSWVYRVLLVGRRDEVPHVPLECRFTPISLAAEGLAIAFAALEAKQLTEHTG